MPRAVPLAIDRYKAHAQHVAETRRQEAEVQRQKQMTKQAKIDKWQRRTDRPNTALGVFIKLSVASWGFWLFGALGSNEFVQWWSTTAVVASGSGCFVSFVVLKAVQDAAKADMKAES